MDDLSDWLSYNDEFDILICIPCGVVIMPGKSGGVDGHLEFTHHSKAEKFPLSTSSRRKLSQLHRGRILNSMPQTPGPDSNPVPHLPVLEGLYCLDCPYICRALATMERHARSEHKWSSKSSLHSVCQQLISNA